MMSQEEKIKFIVNNGRYAGSVIELDPGQEYSLGRSFHCDIAIDDPRFAERQLLFNLSDQGVQIKLLADGQLHVDGEAKDTANQSEWRRMDPRSQFVMNDLEFSFEVPRHMIESYVSGQEQAQRTVAGAQSQAKQTETVGASQQLENAVAGGQSSAKQSSHRSLGTEFEELETQVPGGDDDDDQDVEIQVLNKLADELEFESRTGPKYIRKEHLKISQDSSQRMYYWVGGALVVVLFVLIYLWVRQPTSETQRAEQDTEEFGVRGEVEELSPFEFEPEVQSESLTMPTADDPFTAYDQQFGIDAPKPGVMVEDQRPVPQAPVASSAPDRLVAPSSVAGFSEPTQSPEVETRSPEAAVEVNSEVQSPPQLMTGFGTIEAQERGQSGEDEVLAQRQADADINPDLLLVMQGKASPAVMARYSVRELLSGLGLGALDVSIRKPKPDEVAPVVVVQGYVPDRRIWMRAKDILQQDVPGVGKLVDQVSSPEVRKAQLEDWIRQSKLEGRVKTYLSEQGLVAKVNLNPSEEMLWETIARQYVKTFDNMPELFVMRDPGDWLKIRSISFGAKPHFVTEDGAVVVPGAKLPNGYSVVSIKRSGIELRDKFGSYTHVF